jgi:hypothetical protein
MGRPRKRLVHPAPAARADGGREHYIAGLRARLELFDAKEAAALLGVSQDRLYKLPIPRFELSPRRARWPGTALADYLERGMAGVDARASYLAGVRGAGAMTAAAISRVLGLHSDAVPFLGLPLEEWTERGRTLYRAGSLSEWLQQHEAPSD